VYFLHFVSLLAYLCV